MKNRQILFKTFTKVEFHGENDEINKKYLKFYDRCIVGILLVHCFNPLVLRITEACMLPWQQ